MSSKSLLSPFYGGVFVVSGSLMALQIMQARIFSVTTWYHLAFLVIGVAMFGMMAGAMDVHRGDEKQQRAEFGALMTRAAWKFALWVPIALAGQMLLPIISSNVTGTLITLPLISLTTVIPYYFAGVVMALALTRSPYPVGRTYGVDLVGAATGCLAALALMNGIDAPTGVLVLALAVVCSALLFSRLSGAGEVRAWMLRGYAAMLLFVIAANLIAARPFIYPLWIKVHLITQSQLAHDEWNSISRVTVHREVRDRPPFMWGPSPALPPDIRTDFHLLTIDGDAESPIHRFDDRDVERLGFLEYDVTTIAYALPDLERAAIIGVGGGRDVLTARYFGVPHIKALDINNVQISLLTEIEPFRTYAGIFDMPGLELIHTEARSWFSGQHEKFDIIQMSLIDTWAATGAGAYTLSENGLYTVEAFSTLLEDLNDDGVLTVSRWYLPDAANELERLLALSSAALFERGAARPASHMMVATADRIATLVLSKQPLGATQIEALRAQAARRGFDLLITPGETPVYEGFRTILAADGRAELAALAKAHPFDISPPTDRRPFFFNQLRLTDPIGIFRLIRQNKTGAQLGQVTATLNLYVILGFSLLISAYAVLRPLRRELRASDLRFVAAGTAWFFLIGLGFMMLEIALLQRMSIYLGHPSYSLGILLFSLILSTGIGSFLSDRFVLAYGFGKYVWAIAVSIVVVAGMHLTDGTFIRFADAGLPGRAALCVALIMPLGLLLGYGFPTGMAMVRAIDPRPTAWFWCINGVAGVTGTTLAVTLNIAYGLDVTMMLGALCYTLLLVPGAMLTCRPPISNVVGGWKQAPEIASV